jgi:ketosteroid isomerase-like protein
LSEHLDLVRPIYADWERGDFSSNDWADPEIEFVVMDGTSPGRRTGLRALAASWREVLNAWDDFRTIAEEYRELDDERILVLTVNTGRGKVSGLELADVEPKGANLLHIRDGRVTRLVAWWNRERALTDLGLAPEADATGS